MQVSEFEAVVTDLHSVEPGRCFVMRRQGAAYLCLKAAGDDIPAPMFAVLWAEKPDSPLDKRLIRHKVPATVDVLMLGNTRIRPSLNPLDILIAPPLNPEPPAGVMVLDQAGTLRVSVKPSSEELHDNAFVGVADGSVVWAWPTPAAIFTKWEIVVRTATDEWEQLCAFV